jgi:acetyl esterase/lipase
VARALWTSICRPPQANIIGRPVSRTRLLLDLLARPQSHRYGTHPSQRADLHLPDGAGPHPVVVIIHGGSWAATYGKIVMRPIACDLTRRGWAAWNIEYRRIGRGQGGGWPATFEDVAAAIDHLRLIEAPIDTDRVVVVGHSAGGQLALWAAGRSKLPAGAPGSGPVVPLKAAVSQAGVNDLGRAYAQAPGGAVGMLMEGSPTDLPARYAIADPILAVPLQMPVLLVHGTDDQTVSVRRSRDYAVAARAAGGSPDLVEIPGDAGEHRKHIDPGGSAWQVVPPWLAALPQSPASS